MNPAPLDDHFVRARVAVEVTMRRPRSRTPEVIGTLLGAMYARGKLHHYRVQVGDGLIYLAPPGWLNSLDNHRAISASRVWQDYANPAAIPTAADRQVTEMLHELVAVLEARTGSTTPKGVA
jgi:hypothetical protein